MKVIEGNELIAEFMGAKLIPKTLNEHCTIIQCSFDGDSPAYDGISLSNLLYHSSWDWLMPVLEKIETLKWFDKQKFEITFLRKRKNNKCTCLIYSTQVHFVVDSDSKIEAVWLTVIEFIKWYNKDEKERNLRRK